MAFMMKAFLAALTADVLWCQKPISRYEESPTRPQPIKSCTRLPLTTSTSIENTNMFMYAKKRRSCVSPFMYPIEKTWIRKPTPVTTISISAVSWSNQISKPTRKSPAESHVQAVSVT